MYGTSRTGLIPSPTKKIRRVPQMPTAQFITIARPAPFILKPLAGLYNPFAPGCSLLCNHPTDIDPKEIIKNAKESQAKINNEKFVNEFRGECDIEVNGEQISPTNIFIPQVESVPEELFRRYTDTDSRPLTPAPTLVSGITRFSSARTRRCVTPDPTMICQVKEKTRLILDLRRTHSQETLSIYGGSPFYPDPPEIRIQQLPSSSGSNDEEVINDPNSNKQGLKKTDVNNENEDPEGDDEFVKRRGKKKRKKSRDSAKCPITYQTSIDPETQVATIGLESHNTSARQSLAPEVASPKEPPEDTKAIPKISDTTEDLQNLEIDSFLPKDILKELRREVDEDMVDTELNPTRKIFLNEALKTVLKGRRSCEELQLLKNELNVSPVNSELWLLLPRTFTRASTIFQLPMDSQSLSYLTPLEYVEENVKIVSSRKLLYRCIFDKYKLEVDDENEQKRILDNKHFKSCLDLIMGHPLTNEQFNYFKELIEWRDDISLSFKTCCGVFALCERILSPQFCELPSRDEDLPHEVERVDFESLERKLKSCSVSDNIRNILLHIKNN